MTYSYTKQVGSLPGGSSPHSPLTGHHSNWAGSLLETPLLVEGQHLQSGLVQPPALRPALLQPLPHLQVPPEWRKQGEEVVTLYPPEGVSRQLSRMWWSTVRHLPT